MHVDSNRAVKRLGDLLIEDKRITQAELSKVLAQQEQLNATSKRKFKLGEILLFMKLITRPELEDYLKRQKPRTRDQIDILRGVKKGNGIKKYLYKRDD